jgi:Tfp pilus assembly PilM family ATPase
LFSQNSLGVAIKEDSICLVYLTSSFTEVRLAAYEVHPLDSEMPAGKRVLQAGERINAFMKTNGIGEAPIYIGIPANKALLKTLVFPMAVK